MNPTDHTDAPEQTQELVPAPAPEARAVTKFTAEHGMEVGLPSPEAINYMMSVAKLVSNSALVTKDMGVGDQVKSNALAKMLIGHEMGMKPMESLQEIDIVKGKIFLRYPTLLNEIMKRGFKWRWMERSNTRAAMQITRPGEEPELFEYTIEDARMAGMMYPDSQYYKRPRVMLSARVISEVYRNTGGRSNVYTPEEKSEVLELEPADTPAAPEPEHDPYAVQMPAATSSPANSDAGGKNGASSTAPASPRSSNSVAPILESAANDAQVGGAPSTAAEPSSSRPGSPGRTGDANVTVAPPQSGREDASNSLRGADTVDAAPNKIQEMPTPKTNGGPSLADIEKMLPAKTRKKTIDEFLRGYFRKADLKAIIADPGFPDALRCLAANATSEWVGKLQADPHGVGVKCAAGWKALKAYAWSEETRGYLETLALKLYPDAGGGLLADMLTLVQADTMPTEELQAFLWVLERVPDTVAVKFWKRARSMAGEAMIWGNLTPAEIADAIEALPEPQEQGSLLTEGA